MCRTRGLKRDYRALSEGPIDSQLLSGGARQTRLRRASAGSDTSDEPPRKRGRPAKKAPVDSQATSPATGAGSDRSENMMIDIPAFGTPVMPRSPSLKDQEGGNLLEDFVTSGDNCHNNTTDKPDVDIFSPIEDVAALLLAVAEQARLEVAEQALAAQTQNLGKKTTKKRGSGKQGRGRKRRS